MSEGASFPDLIRRVRDGDQAAAVEVVQRYEPAIRRAIRYRLANTRLTRLLDSMDICQSVMASFFVRAAAGQYDLDQPEQLLKLLVAMARNKLAYRARAQRAQRRDNRRVAANGLEEAEVAAAGPSPSRAVSAQELLDEVHRRLAPDERHLVELRNDGMEWADIAAREGGSAEALRKKLARAIDRVAQELGLDEP